MPAVDVRSAPPQLPDGYLAIAVSSDQQEARLRLCAVVRREPDPVAGHLVLLRDLLDALVYLGCITDAQGQIHQWVELWVQNLDKLAQSPPACREALSNLVLDQRWEHTFQSLKKLDPALALATGWETQNPLPTLLDLKQQAPLHPLDAQSGGHWQLCRDDAFLQSKDLPAYSTSLHRYLYLPEAGSASPLVPLTFEAPTNAQTRYASTITGSDKSLVALNLGGGRMLVRKYTPVGFEDYLNVLSGASWDGLPHGRTLLDLTQWSRGTAADDGSGAGHDGRLFMGQHGKWGRLIEAFHLKLRLLTDIVGAVGNLARQTQRPLFTLNPESLAVNLGPPGVGLPYLWTARAVLVDPGEAVALPIKSSDAQYYLRGGTPGISMYRPDAADRAVEGRANLRIRQIVSKSAGVMVLEGTLATQQRLELGKYDLLWLRVNLSSGRIDLYAYVEKESAMARGEWRFRTIGQRLGDGALADLRAAEGVPLSNNYFEVIPLISTPCDLYALGVLAVRALLVNEGTTLPVALDGILSLARQVAEQHDTEAGLGLRINALFEQDKRWATTLGPQLLLNEPMTPEEAFDLVPSELWGDTLAMIIRCFPGLGPDSRCQDLGDAPPNSVHKIFEGPQADLENLLLRTRSLIVIDWRFNREIHAVLRSYATGLTPAAAPTR